MERKYHIYENSWYCYGDPADDQRHLLSDAACAHVCKSRLGDRRDCAGLRDLRAGCLVAGAQKRRKQSLGHGRRAAHNDRRRSDALQFLGAAFHGYGADHALWRVDRVRRRAAHCGLGAAQICLVGLRGILGRGADPGRDLCAAASGGVADLAGLVCGVCLHLPGD